MKDLELGKAGLAGQRRVGLERETGGSGSIEASCIWLQCGPGPRVRKCEGTLKLSPVLLTLSGKVFGSNMRLREEIPVSSVLKLEFSLDSRSGDLAPVSLMNQIKIEYSASDSKKTVFLWVGSSSLTGRSENNVWFNRLSTWLANHHAQVGNGGVKGGEND